MLIKGITKLSELNIDADKDWNTKGITNIKQVAAAMSTGNIVQHNGTILVRLMNGPDTYVLTSQGTGKLLTWAPPAGALKYYLPISISSALYTAIVAASQSVSKNAALAITKKYTTGDDPADGIKQIQLPLSSAKSLSVKAAADQAVAKNVPVKCGLSILVDGFVEETALGVQTDHTAAARDGTANDLNLNPMSDTVLDKIYIGSNYKFWQAQMQLGTQGVGNWTNAWYYWNGVAWVAVVGELDGANEWQASPGLTFINHTPQADWALTTILGMNLYWLMSRTDAFVNRTTKPLGSQAWVAINV